MKNIRETVCKKFNELLETSRLQQVDIAKAIGVSKNSVTLWKKGESCPTIANIEALAEVFKVDPRSFFFDESAPSPNAKAIEEAALLLKGAFSSKEKSHPLHEKIEEFLSNSPNEKQIESLIRSIDAATKAAQISSESKQKVKKA